MQKALTKLPNGYIINTVKGVQKIMDKLILLGFDFILLTIYSLIGFISFMLIQGIVYWVTGFSIYNWLMKKLF